MSTPRLEPFSVAQVYEEHRELAEQLQETGRLFKRRDRVQKQVDRQMCRLAELIENHFAHEEGGGYMAEAIARVPHIAAAAERLLAEHTDLLDDAKKLQMLARFGIESPAWWRQVEDDYQRLQKRLLAHEHAENKLLHEAYNRDIGAAD